MVTNEDRKAAADWMAERMALSLDAPDAFGGAFTVRRGPRLPMHTPLPGKQEIE